MTKWSKKEINKQLKEHFADINEGVKPIMRICPVCKEEKKRNRDNFQHRSGAWLVKCRVCLIKAKKERRAVYDKERNIEKRVKRLKEQLKELERMKNGN
jgi:hypothetical protein